MPYNPIASDEAGGAGGTCVLRGCVPKKLFVYASEYREAFSDAEGFGCAPPGLGAGPREPPAIRQGDCPKGISAAARRGTAGVELSCLDRPLGFTLRRAGFLAGCVAFHCRWQLGGQPALDWPTFLSKKNAELQRLNGVYMNLLNNSGVDVGAGAGRGRQPPTEGTAALHACQAAALLLARMPGPHLPCRLACQPPRHEAAAGRTHAAHPGLLHIQCTPCCFSRLTTPTNGPSPHFPTARQYIEGRGKLVDAHTVDVGGRRVTARNILIATGARAFVPPFEGHELCIISDNALEVPEVRRLVAQAAGEAGVSAGWYTARVRLPRGSCAAPVPRILRSVSTFPCAKRPRAERPLATPVLSRWPLRACSVVHRLGHAQHGPCPFLQTPPHPTPPHSTPTHPPTHTHPHPHTHTPPPTHYPRPRAPRRAGAQADCCPRRRLHRRRVCRHLCRPGLRGAPGVPR